MGSSFHSSNNDNNSNSLSSENSRLKEQLIEKDLFYQHLLTSANISIIKINHNHRITSVNNIAEQLFEYKKEELIGTSIDTTIFRSRIIPSLLEELQINHSIDITCQTKSNKPLYIRLMNGGENISNSEDEYILIAMDMTTTHEHEQQIKENEQTLDLFFTQSLDGFFFAKFANPISWNENVNKDEIVKQAINNQVITKANKALLKQYNTSEDQFINNNPNVFYTYQPHSEIDIFNELFENGKIHVSTNILRHDNETIHIEGNYICRYNREGQIIGYFGVQRDITEHFNAINKLKTSKDQYRFLINNVLDVIWILDVESGQFTYISPSVFKLRGYTHQEAINQSIEDVLTSKSLAFAHHLITTKSQEYITTGFEEVMTVDLEQKCKDGSTIWTETISYFRKNPKSGRLEIIGSSRDINERKIAQKALDEMKERYKLITEFSADFIALHDTNGNFIYVSPSIKNMLGYEPEELVGTHPIDYVLPEDYDNFYHTIQNTNEQDYASSFEIRFRHKNGTYIWLETQLSRSRNENNTPNKVIAIHRDISWRIKMQQQLRESEQRFKTFTELTNEGIIIYKDEQIIDVNPSVKRIIGLSNEEHIHPNLFTYVAPKDHSQLINHIKNNAIGSFEIDVVSRNQQVVPVEICIKKAIIKGDEVSVIAINDISERKKAITQIQKLSTALEQSPVSIVITNTEGIIEYVNPRFTVNTGFTFEEAIGENPRILKTEYFSKGHYTKLWNTILSGEIWKGEFLNRRKDGSTFWELATIAPIKNEDNDIEGFVAVKEDITDRKTIMERLNTTNLKLKEANAAKDKFFSIIAHDLRSPMAQIVSLAQILTSGKADDSNREMFINSILDSSLKVSSLLDDLLTWARTQMGKYEIKPEEFNIFIAVQKVIENLEENLKAKDLTVNINPNTNSLAYCDLNTLRLVIRNLISNAIKFSFRGNKITVKITEATNNQIKISIIDYGVGISPDVLPHLFSIDKSISTYGTENEKGTGLGLMICKEFIERNKGQIWAESEIGVQTAIHFTIPIAIHKSK